MFALGIVLYILLCGSHPFDPYNNLTDEEVRVTVDLVRNPISPSAQDLIRKLLEIDPDKRPNAEQALQHP
ncbi:hypothetical protein PsorP6_008085 [Peronosclerospora sorghi]|uniref:Uncharacterized protein n=2 Tax=Peronosclerospora sorghi TaxID=230839 RepID=A0ACC0VIA5_9STRA|nr:hypothetical protein PsorP6_003943 [Peronosclerospora sorghi]KAI9915535.1 hypothetical protein PsorP6_008085 [Peronosclerospora sorghi]